MKKLYRDENGNQWDGNLDTVPDWVKTIIDQGGDIEDYNLYRFEDEEDLMDEPDVMKCIVTHEKKVVAAFWMAKLKPTEALVNLLRLFDEHHPLHAKMRRAYLGEGARTWPPTFTLAIGPSGANTFESMYLFDFVDCALGIKDGVTYQEGQLYLQGEVMLMGADLAEDDDPEEAEYEVLATHDDELCRLNMDDSNGNIITTALNDWKANIKLKIDDDDNEEIWLKVGLNKITKGWQKHAADEGVVIYSNADPGVFNDLKMWLEFFGIYFDYDFSGL